MDCQCCNELAIIGDDLTALIFALQHLRGARPPPISRFTFPRWDAGQRGIAGRGGTKWRITGILMARRDGGDEVTGS